MFRQTALALACSAALAAWLPASANTSPKDAAYECARIIRDRLGTGAYEVVRMTELPGRASYRIWMNAHDASGGAYCATRRGSVTESFTRDLPWDSRSPARPATLQLAAGCDTRSGV